MDVRFLVAGDTAVVVEFGDRVDRQVSERVLQLSVRVRAANIPGVTETVPTYRSLMVLHDPLEGDTSVLIEALRTLVHTGSEAPVKARRWRIPACYDEPYAPDLHDVASRTGLPPEEIVRLHSTIEFHVYMIGFVPGFPYMGDLPPALFLPRRTDPRVKVPAGSVAIAAGQTAIYPIESPGGWHLIGATPVPLFDAARPRAALLAPGDKVRFERITPTRFEALRSAVQTSAYDVPCETVYG